MKLHNTSPYDTRALRSIAVAVYRWLRKREQRKAHVIEHGTLYVVTNRPQQAPDDMSMGWVKVPKLTGNEWHEAARGVMNGSALTTEAFARGVCWWVMRAYGSRSGSNDVDPKVLRRLPEFVPLKIIKPKPPRNLVRERYERTLELEKSWMRKQKLATTKVKLYRKRRRYYEQRLAGKEES